MACFESFLLAAVSAATEGNNGRVRVILRVLLIDGTGYLPENPSQADNLASRATTGIAVLLTLCSFSGRLAAFFFAIRASIYLISAHPNWPKFIFGFMGWAGLKPPKARFGYNRLRPFLIGRTVFAHTVVST